MEHLSFSDMVGREDIDIEILLYIEPVYTSPSSDFPCNIDRFFAKFFSNSKVETAVRIPAFRPQHPLALCVLYKSTSSITKY
jgi:hypothetical protein